MTRRGWLLFAAMCVLWGIPYLLIKVAVRDLAPPTLVFLRTGIGALVLLPVAGLRGELRPVLARWRPLLAFAVLEVTVPWLLLSDAERVLSSSLTGLLVAAVPLVAAVAARAAGDPDRLDRTRVAGLLLGVAGVAALLGLDLGGNDRLSALEVGVVVLGYATAPLVASRKLSDVPGTGVVAAALGFTALVYLPFAVANPPSPLLPDTAVVVSVVVLALVCTVAAFLVFFALIAEAGPQRALVITFVNPAVAVALGIALLDEPLTRGVVVGFPLVLAGSLLATRRSVAVRATTPASESLAEPVGRP